MHPQEDRNIAGLDGEEMEEDDTQRFVSDMRSCLASRTNPNLAGQLHQLLSDWADNAVGRIYPEYLLHTLGQRCAGVDLEWDVLEGRDRKMAEALRDAGEHSGVVCFLTRLQKKVHGQIKNMKKMSGKVWTEDRCDMLFASEVGRTRVWRIHTPSGVDITTRRSVLESNIINFVEIDDRGEPDDEALCITTSDEGTTVTRCFRDTALLIMPRSALRDFFRIPKDNVQELFAVLDGQTSGHAVGLLESLISDPSLSSDSAASAALEALRLTRSELFAALLRKIDSPLSEEFIDLFGEALAWKKLADSCFQSPLADGLNALLDLHVEDHDRYRSLVTLTRCVPERVRNDPSFEKWWSEQLDHFFTDTPQPMTSSHALFLVEVSLCGSAKFFEERALPLLRARINDTEFSCKAISKMAEPRFGHLDHVLDVVERMFLVLHPRLLLSKKPGPHPQSWQLTKLYRDLLALDKPRRAQQFILAVANDCIKNPPRSTDKIQLLLDLCQDLIKFTGSYGQLLAFQKCCASLDHAWTAILDPAPEFIQHHTTTTLLLQVFKNMSLGAAADALMAKVATFERGSWSKKVPDEFIPFFTSIPKILARCWSTPMLCDLRVSAVKLWPAWQNRLLEQPRWVEATLPALFELEMYCEINALLSEIGRRCSPAHSEDAEAIFAEKTKWRAAVPELLRASAEKLKNNKERSGVTPCIETCRKIVRSILDRPFINTSHMFDLASVVRSLHLKDERRLLVRMIRHSTNVLHDIDLTFFLFYALSPDWTVDDKDILGNEDMTHIVKYTLLGLLKRPLPLGDDDISTALRWLILLEMHDDLKRFIVRAGQEYGESELQDFLCAFLRHSNHKRLDMHQLGYLKPLKRCFESIAQHTEPASQKSWRMNKVGCGIETCVPCMGLESFMLDCDLEIGTFRHKLAIRQHLLERVALLVKKGGITYSISQGGRPLTLTIRKTKHRIEVPKSKWHSKIKESVAWLRSLGAESRILRIATNAYREVLGDLVHGDVRTGLPGTIPLTTQSPSKSNVQQGGTTSMKRSHIDKPDIAKSVKKTKIEHRIERQGMTVI